MEGTKGASIAAATATWPQTLIRLISAQIFASFAIFYSNFSSVPSVVSGFSSSASSPGDSLKKQSETLRLRRLADGSF
jgi:hypothetical protein